MGPNAQLLRGIDKLVEHWVALRAEQVGAVNASRPGGTLTVEVPKRSVVGSIQGGKVERVDR